MRRRTLMQGGIDISSAVVTAPTQTYTGSALTPNVRVVRNGQLVDASGYDVAYSDNTNAGTATITVTGKGDYEGTATGSFTINPKALSITASNQTITYGSSISKSTSKVSTSGLVSGDSLTSITLSQSTTSVTTSGTITPSNARTTKGISNYSVSYYTGTLVINKATGSVSFNTKTCSVGYDGGTTGTLYVRTTGSGWVKTSDKTVSGYNVYKSVSNYHVFSSYSVFKLTFVNSTGASVSTTLKLGPATESSFDYSYIAEWNAADITSAAVPSTTLGIVTASYPEWTDVSVTIPTGTNTLQIVYRKDGSVNNSPDCGYVAIPYDISFGTISINKPVITGDGTVTWSSSNTSAVSVNSSTGLLTVNGAGTATITASMAAGTCYTSASASYTLTVNALVPIGNVSGFSYTGSYQSKTLSPGIYKLQVWGAQGGSNGANSEYGITAQAGGKGGYSEGQLTIPSATTVRVYVGGQGSSSSGGYNGGGSTSGTSSKTNNKTFGYSKMGGGGGATDIRLSDGSLYSRMIVAGGGSGGAMDYFRNTTTVDVDTLLYTRTYTYAYYSSSMSKYIYAWNGANRADSLLEFGKRYKVVVTLGSGEDIMIEPCTSSDQASGSFFVTSNQVFSVTQTSSVVKICVNLRTNSNSASSYTVKFYEVTSQTSITTNNNSQVGYVGGGTNGGGYSSSYYGKQNAAGSGGSFGQGANQTYTGYRYCSGAGGGGWYGGGRSYSDQDFDYCKYSGGGSGFVNTAANASYRPSGYIGLVLDSGSTTAGSSSFPSTSGSTETGHSGNGYAKITRLS